MAKGIEAEKNKEPAIFEDSIITGLLLAKGFKVTPVKNSDGRIVYKVEGNDIEKSIHEIYSNCPVGSLDVLRAIKLTRSMIFNLRGQR
ncbi:MAG: hypothetical protein V2A53_00135 [bacterium]